MYKVYGDYKSGNCYKVKLMLNLLGIPYQWIDVDILKGDTQTAEFLAKNPNGKIPVLELEDGTCLWESNAILNFLADGSFCRPSHACARKCCNGSFSSSTATNRILRWRGLSSFTWACPQTVLRNTRSCTKVATRRSKSWSANCN